LPETGNFANSAVGLIIRLRQELISAEVRLSYLLTTDPSATPALPTEAEVDGRIAEVFGSAGAVPNQRAFDFMSIEKSTGYELIARGHLRRIKIGRSSRITVGSIKEVLLNGVPPMPKAGPPAGKKIMHKKAAPRIAPRAAAAPKNPPTASWASPKLPPAEQIRPQPQAAKPPIGRPQ
jgi:hypothetical protein